jgi:D-glycero-D-manno-heptose 1,7-bisphosphate phosphatase
LRRAVFLDRDGVINRSLAANGRPVAPKRLKEFRLLPGARRSITRLRRRGFKIAVVTNQPDVAKGLIDRDELARMNARLAPLGADVVKVCPHAQDAGCGCRKPKPGMLRAAARDLGVALGRSYMVGDRWSDVEAGRAAGCYTVKIERRWSNERPSRPDAVVRSLAEAVKHILEREKRSAKK